MQEWDADWFDVFFCFFSETLSIQQTTEECVPDIDWHIFLQRQRKLIILCQMGLLIAKMGGWINERLGSWLMGWLFEDVVNRTNHWGACTRKWLTHILLLQRNGENFSFFSHSRQISFLHSAWGIVTNYVSRIYDVRRNRATQLVEQMNVHISDSDIPTSA